MRHFLLIFFLIISLHSFSQDELSKQVNQLMADSANNFRSFRSSFKELFRHDSTYNTTITLAGTKSNQITVFDTTSETSTLKCIDIFYDGIITDSIKKKRAIAIADEWKSKFIAILGEKFEVKQQKIVIYDPAEYGWIFNWHNFQVSINIFRIRDSSLYTVKLGIGYSPGCIEKIIDYQSR